GNILQYKFFKFFLLTFLLVIGSISFSGCSGGGSSSSSAGSRTIKITPEYLFIHDDTETIELSKSSPDNVQINLSETATGINIESDSCLIPSDRCELWTISAETWTTPATYIVPIAYIGTVFNNLYGKEAYPAEKITVLPSEGIEPATRLVAGSGGQSFMWSGTEVMAWGHNDKAQLGLGYVSVVPSHESYNSLPATTLSSFNNIQAIAAGGSHSLALLSDGSVWAWGDNDFGQLGNDTKVDSPTPVQAIGLTNVQTIAAGEHHSLALLSDGSVWIWGDNSYEQLQQLDPVYKGGYSSIPVKSYTLHSGIIAIAAGDNHTLALDSNGAVWAWGENDYGQLGSTSTDSDHNFPIQVVVPGIVEAIAAGANHSLALRNDNTVWAWGSNWSGQLGNETNIDSVRPVQVMENVKAVSTVENHSLALDKNGTVWTWGNNISGQLADGSRISRNKPIEVSGLENVQAVAAGKHHSLALKSDCGTAGTVWAWGGNHEGELGIGLLGIDGSETSPVPVWGVGNDSCDMKRVTLYLTGDGNGTVTSNAGTVECSWRHKGGQYCWLEVPQSTASVTLSATPDAVSELRDWRWDCSSSGTDTNVTLIMNSNKNCKVTFNSFTITDNCPNDPDKLEPGICGCGVPDIDSNHNGTMDCLEACLDVSGAWTLFVGDINSSCGSESDWSSVITINQTVCSLETTGIKDSNATVKGSIVGGVVTIGPGKFSEGTGTTTALYTMKIQADGNMIGNELWSWNDGFIYCTDGTAKVTATKQ
ncbi:MAG: hypothetical protein U9O83_00080, partial [Campylobacterota bacterium]|nr:hypothetical protein [Campylobacterota bacterium]